MEEVDSEEYERDMTAFMEDLEEDKHYHQNINILYWYVMCSGDIDTAYAHVSCRCGQSYGYMYIYTNLVIEENK